ncbi:MAG TPA: SgcJ/EcaC family oxidoreductase [Pseudonocardiaceae bacterium]|nr:SgcJ/EcaC family oxidoreductase [Pseudonocardiaceae bacterium]
MTGRKVFVSNVEDAPTGAYPASLEEVSVRCASQTWMKNRKIFKQASKGKSIMSVSNVVLAEDEVAVRNALDSVLAAWANNDGDAFAERFGEDATIVTVEGLYCKGREPIRSLLTMLYAGPFKDSKVFQEVEDIRFIGDNVAVVICWNAILLDGLTELPPEEKRRATYVLSRHDREWLVEAFQNVFITELPTETG